MNKYSLNIFWSDEDKGYIATCPEFQGLSAFGDTPEEAIAEARVALQLFIDSYQQDGEPLPEPQVAQRYSGQFRLRLPQSLHAQLARMAEIEGASLNQFILDALAERVGGQKIHERMLGEMRRAIADLVTQNSFISQSLDWSEPKLGQFEVEQVVTTAFSIRPTASNKGTTKRGQ